jgi:hypothetical protein
VISLQVHFPLFLQRMCTTLMDSRSLTWQFLESMGHYLQCFGYCAIHTLRWAPSTKLWIPSRGMI